MAGPDGQKAPKTSGNNLTALTSGLVNLSTTCDRYAFLTGYLMMGSILSFISLMLLVMSFAR